MKNSEKIVKPRLNQCATLGSLVGYGEKKKVNGLQKKAENHQGGQICRFCRTNSIYQF